MYDDDYRAREEEERKQKFAQEMREIAAQQREAELARRRANEEAERVARLPSNINDQQGIGCFVAMMAFFGGIWQRPKLSSVFHDAHEWLGVGSYSGQWFYVVGIIGLICFVLYSPRAGNIFGGVLIIGLILAGVGVQGDSALHQRARFEETRLQTFVLTGAMNVRSKPNRNGRVLRQLPSGSHVLLGPKDGSGWAAIYDRQTRQPSGYLFRAGEHVQPLKRTKP